MKISRKSTQTRNLAVLTVKRNKILRKKSELTDTDLDIATRHVWERKKKKSKAVQILSTCFC